MDGKWTILWDGVLPSLHNYKLNIMWDTNFYLYLLFRFLLRATFHPAYGRISLLTNLFSSVPLLAHTGTATTATKSGIVTALGLSNLVTVECSPNRTYASHVRPDRGGDKLGRILEPCCCRTQIKEAGHAPHSYLWKARNKLSLFPVFSNEMGKDQYHPSAEPSAKNRLFHHVSCPISRAWEKENSRWTSKWEIKPLCVVCDCGIWNWDWLQ